MEKPSSLLVIAAAIKSEADKALRFAAGLPDADHARFIRYGDDLREKAANLERLDATQAPPRSAEPSPPRTQDGQKQKKGRGGSNHPAQQH